MHNGVVQTHGHGLGTCEATGPTRQVLDGDTEAATSLSHQQVLAGPRKSKDQPIECHIVGGTRCLAPSAAPLTCAVPALALAHTNVAVFLDGGIGWVPLPVVTTGTKIRRHTVLVLVKGENTVLDSEGSRAGSLCRERDFVAPGVPFPASPTIQCQEDRHSHQCFQPDRNGWH